MIALVEGKLGAGKSLFAMRLVDDAIGAGKPVATNVELTPDALYRAAGAHPLRRWFPALRQRRAAKLSRLVFSSHDLGELMRVRLAGEGESRGVLVLDECHNWMNARSWSSKDRDELIRFFSQSRKLGFDVYLIAQRAEMIDKQVRNLAEYRITLKNLRWYRKMGLRLPCNLFVAIWRWEAHANAEIVRRDVYPLSRRVAGMYDTLATSHGLAHELPAVEAIRLPRPAAPTDARVSARRGPAGAGSQPAAVAAGAAVEGVTTGAERGQQ